MRMESCLFYVSMFLCLHVFTQEIYGYDSDKDKVCPDSWVAFQDQCYRVMKQGVSWSEAEQTCRAWNRGHLVSITSQAEQELVEELATSEGISGSLWMGYRQNKYEWTDGSEVFYEDWNSNRPTSQNQRTAYVFLSRSNRWKWYDVQYGSHQYVPLCKRKVSESGECPDESYWAWSTFCYRLQPVMKSFVDSEQLCTSQGSHLASVNSEAEMTFLRAQLTRHTGNNVWIGMRLADKPFEFRWTDDCVTSSNYTNWRTGVTDRTDVPNVGSICVKLDKTQGWKWSMVGCNREGNLYYVCESSMVATALYESCPSQTVKVTDELAAENSVTDPHTAESLDGSFQCEKHYNLSRNIIILVGVMLVVESVLVILLICFIISRRKRSNQDEQQKMTKPPKVFRRSTGLNSEVTGIQPNDRMVYSHKNPEGLEGPGATPGFPTAPLASYPGKGWPIPARDPVPPPNPRTNDYIEYKTPANANEINSKEEGNYSYVADEYEELPLKNTSQDYEIPKA